MLSVEQTESAGIPSKSRNGWNMVHCRPRSRIRPPISRGDIWAVRRSFSKISAAKSLTCWRISSDNHYCYLPLPLIDASSIWQRHARGESRIGGHIHG